MITMPLRFWLPALWHWRPSWLREHKRTIIASRAATTEARIAAENIRRRLVEVDVAIQVRKRLRHDCA